MKTVIHVWTHEFNINHEHLLKYNYYNEKEFYFGLGDLMRSTIKLYELSKIMNSKVGTYLILTIRQKSLWNCLLLEFLLQFLASSQACIHLPMMINVSSLRLSC